MKDNLMTMIEITRPNYKNYVYLKKFIISYPVYSFYTL